MRSNHSPTFDVGRALETYPAVHATEKRPNCESTAMHCSNSFVQSPAAYSVSSILYLVVQISLIRPQPDNCGKETS